MNEKSGPPVRRKSIWVRDMVPSLAGYGSIHSSERYLEHVGYPAWSKSTEKVHFPHEENVNFRNPTGVSKCWVSPYNPQSPSWFHCFYWHRDMRPAYSFQDAVNSTFAYSVSLRNNSFRYPAHPVHFPHEHNVYFADVYSFLILPTLLNHVVAIILMASGRVMGRVAAWWVIAGVENALSSWVNSSRDEVGDAVGKKKPCPGYPNPAIPFFAFAAIPWPALAWITAIYFSPESFNLFVGKYWNCSKLIIRHLISSADRCLGPCETSDISRGSLYYCMGQSR